jgi:hypothetical protein
MEGSRSGSVQIKKQIRMHIQRAKKRTDPDPDPEHWYTGSVTDQKRRMTVGT